MARDKVATVGRAAVGAFLLKLQTHKSLGDADAGRALFGAYAEVPPAMAARRAVVMARKEPRALLVQPHMALDGAGGGAGEATLRSFDESPRGMVESFVARYPAEDPELLALYEQEKAQVTD